MPCHQKVRNVGMYKTGVRCGIDTFDCVHPTRLGRHGGALVKTAHWAEEDFIPAGGEAVLFTTEATPETNAQRRRKMSPRKLVGSSGQRVVREHISLDKARMRNDPRPIEPDCTCYTCKNFSRAYLHHLFKAQETLGSVLVTCHNIHFMNKLMTTIRNGIETDSLDEVEKLYVHPDLIELKDNIGS